MRFVLLNQFYPPDVLPTGVVLKAVAGELVARGHQVTVISGQLSGGSCQWERGAPAPPRVPPGAPPGEALEESSAFNHPGQGEEENGENLETGKSENGAGGGKRVWVVRLWVPGWGRRKSASGKVLSYASYYGGVAAWLLRRRQRADVILALTSPPYLSLLARMGAWWHGGRHAHWVMDLYPDVMVAHGMLRTGGWAERVLAGLARWGMSGERAGRVITLGPDMADRLSHNLPQGKKADWVPLWGTAVGAGDDSAVAALREHRGWGLEEVVFLYSGNMGLGHRFTEVLQAMPQLAAVEPDRRVRLAFYGEGKRKREVEEAVGSGQSSVVREDRGAHAPPGIPPGASAGCQLHGQPPSDRRKGAIRVQADITSATVCPASDLRIEVHGYVPSSELAVHLRTGDVHLASLDPAWDGMMVPSKLQGIFAAGRPVLFTGSRTCSIGRWILESGGGWVCEPGDIAGHVQAMQEALDPIERTRRGEAAHQYASKHFDRATNVTKIADWLESRD